ncbi:MAG: peptide deformylase [Rickettsiales bacterium]|nr:MAG: peptide deformylase [Rickettsiales bacterium]
MIYDIVTLNDPILKKESEEVVIADKELKSLADDLLETMYKAKGVGLAGVQVGILKRIIVVDVKQRDGETQDEQIASRHPHILVNPVITWKSDEVELMDEGCLSVPGEKEQVLRHLAVEVEYQDTDLKPQKIKAEGYLAQALQHEIDHINGICYTDRISKLKRDKIKTKIKKYCDLKIHLV